MTKEFVLKSLLPYKLDTNKCAINDGTCMYLDDETGNKCAIGQWMKEGEWQKEVVGIDTLLSEYNEYKLKEVFEQEFIDNYNTDLMFYMQRYHDQLAEGNYKKVNEITTQLEIMIKEELEELKYDI